MSTIDSPQNAYTKAPGRVPLKVIGIIYIVLGGLMVVGLFYDVAAIGVMPVLYAVLRLFVGIYGVAMCDNLAKADNLQALAVFNLFLTVSWRGAGVFAVLGMIVLSILFLVGAVRNRKAYGKLQRQE